MIRIAIVEDDRHDREALKKCLNRYEKENQVKFSVTEFQDGEDIVTDYTASYDLIILDIEMAFLNGMKAAEKIRELDTNVIIIFITNMPQYAIQGYKVNALDYILKPISYFSFSESMVRALAKVKTPEKEYITIVLKGGKKKLDVARICYVEVQDHVLIYHTLDGDFKIPIQSVVDQHMVLNLHVTNPRHIQLLFTSLQNNGNVLLLRCLHLCQSPYHTL